MSSIDPKQESALVRFYQENIVPLARANGMEFLDRSPGSSSESYFLARPRTRLSREEFVLKLADEKQAIATLEARWVETPLRGMAKRLIKFTRSYFPKVQEKTEISSAFYEMF
jgi:hypothetical protein